MVSRSCGMERTVSMHKVVTRLRISVAAKYECMQSQSCNQTYIPRAYITSYHCVAFGSMGNQWNSHAFSGIQPLKGKGKASREQRENTVGVLAASTGEVNGGCAAAARPLEVAAIYCA